MNSGRFIIAALFLLLVGAVLPFLMTIRVVESTFFLNFISYVASVAGLFIGILGIAMYVGKTKNKNDMQNYWDDHDEF
jgi:hypothetical protein